MTAASSILDILLRSIIRIENRIQIRPIFVTHHAITTLYSQNITKEIKHLYIDGSIEIISTTGKEGNEKYINYNYIQQGGEENQIYQFDRGYSNIISSWLIRSLGYIR